MIAEKFRMSETKPPRLYQLVCGTQVLDNKSTLGRSYIRGKVTLTLIVRNESESEKARVLLADIVAQHVSACGRHHNTNHLNPCVHAKQVLAVAQCFRGECPRGVFPCAETTCAGNAWIINSVFPLITPINGRFGRDVLADSWNVRPQDSSTPITRSIARSVLEEFLHHRPALGSWNDYFENEILEEVDSGVYDAVLGRLLTTMIFGIACH